MYSAVEVVKAQQLIATLSAYPNPTVGQVKVKIPTSMHGTYYLKLYDAAGKLILSKVLQMQQGNTETDLNISRFAAGNYQLVCHDDQSRFVTRISKH
jgi:acyl-coenzyme A thioesterase PaaI-like protein